MEQEIKSALNKGTNGDETQNVLDPVKITETIEAPKVTVLEGASEMDVETTKQYDEGIAEEILKEEMATDLSAIREALKTETYETITDIIINLKVKYPELDFNELFTKVKDNDGSILEEQVSNFCNMYEMECSNYIGDVDAAFLPGFKKVFKSVGKKVKDVAKNTRSTITNVTQKLGKSAANLLLTPIIPFKPLMKKTLETKGISVPKRITNLDLVTKFYNEVVQKDHYLEKDWYEKTPEYHESMAEFEERTEGVDNVIGVSAIAGVVAAIISFLKKMKAKKEAGIVETESETMIGNDVELTLKGAELGLSAQEVADLIDQNAASERMEAILNTSKVLINDVKKVASGDVSSVKPLTQPVNTAGLGSFDVSNVGEFVKKNILLILLFGVGIGLLFKKFN